MRWCSSKLDDTLNNNNIFCRNYKRKSQVAPPDVTEIVNECIWNALENAFKNGLKSANGCKIWPIIK